MTVVPTIDLRSPDGPDRIDDACANVGFFQLVGHGVDPAVERVAWEQVERFFSLPDETKAAVTIPDGDAYGYGPFRAERLAASRGVQTPADLKETFSVGPPRDVCEAEVAADPAAAFVYSLTPWPSELPEFRDAMRAYYEELAAVAARVLSKMAVGLRLGADFFETSIDRHGSALRALRYPPLWGIDVEGEQQRAGAHSDYGTITLLRQQAGRHGLQVLGADDAWHDVEPVDGAYVVNVGDALARWTNDRWRSTLHRVVVLADRGERMSMAFFHNANWDAVIDRLDPTVPRRYEPVTAGQHLMDKFRRTQ